MKPVLHCLPRSIAEEPKLKQFLSTFTLAKPRTALFAGYKEKDPKTPMADIDIKRASISDIEALQEIGRLTFAETFAADNTEEDMIRYLDEEFSIEKLKAGLSDKDSEIYFALLHHRVIGYLKLNFGESQTEVKDENTFEIERIYVLKEFHGKKVGQQLYDKAMAIARQKGVDYVWLGVWEKNPRAIRFYRKNGFVEFDKHIFKLGTDEQTDIMMKLKMKE